MTRWIGIILLSVLTYSCSGDVATPRRHAFPRVPLADTTYIATAIPGTPFSIDVNSDAVMSVNANQGADAVWVNLSYPIYRGATAYFTFTPVSSAEKLSEVVDNRLERIGLNAGSANTEVSEFLTPEGFICRTFVTPSALVTPVQFLAIPTDESSSGWVISGAFNLEDATSADSVAPIVQAVNTDIIRALRSLSAE